MTQKKDQDISLAVKALKIGNKVKELRQKNRYTLQDLAARTGLSKPFLSRIENGYVVPPIATLLKLSRGLNVRIVHFFEDASENEKVSLTHPWERIRIERRPHQGKERANYVYELLETKKLKKNMEPFLIEFRKLDSDEIVFMTHEGEEFLYVIEGKIEFRTVNRSEVLEPGDSIYLESELSHSFRCANDKPAKALAVIWSKS